MVAVGKRSRHRRTCPHATTHHPAVADGHGGMVSFLGRSFSGGTLLRSNPRLPSDIPTGMKQPRLPRHFKCRKTPADLLRVKQVGKNDWVSPCEPFGR
jgi:hypothetical protein